MGIQSLTANVAILVIRLSNRSNKIYHSPFSENRAN